MKNIIVCVKVVPKTEEIEFDPETKTINRGDVENQLNEADKNAIEYALQLREKYGGKVLLLSMGPPFFIPYLKLGIAMGADDALLLSDRAFAGADTYATALVLATAVKKIKDYDLVLCGEESSDGGTGQVPAQIAELLDLPQILFVSELEILENTVKAKKTIKGGFEVLESSMPAVISIELGINQPRFPDFRRKRWVDKEFKITVWNANDLNLNTHEIGLEGSYTRVVNLIEHPIPPRSRKFIDGTIDEQATEIINILKSLSSSSRKDLGN